MQTLIVAIGFFNSSTLPPSVPSFRCCSLPRVGLLFVIFVEDSEEFTEAATEMEGGSGFGSAGRIEFAGHGIGDFGEVLG